jgi:hypothetical protein
MRRLAIFMGLAAAMLAAVPSEAKAFLGWHRCGGCSDPCYTAYAAPVAQPCAPPPVCLDVGPVTQMHVVLVPTYVTEKRLVCALEYREEQRQRAVTCYKTVNVTEEKVRICMVPVTKTETKLIEYTTQVAVQSTQEKKYTIKVPVWAAAEETYTVKVPVLKEIQEQYCVNVPVIKEVPFEYCVNVPYPVTTTVNRTVCTVVPVVKTRTVCCMVPVTKTRTVPVDRGHWEARIEQVGGGPVQPSAKGAPVQAPMQAPSKGVAQAPIQAPGKGMEKQAPAPQVVCRQVWVANIVQEEVHEVVQQAQTAEVQYLVYEQHYNTVPYECVCIEYRPEMRTGMKKVCSYQPEVRTRPRTIVEYVSETRTRPKQVMSFQEEERVETYPVVNYMPEKRTKEVSYSVCYEECREEKYTVTRCVQVPDVRIETYTERVCVPVMKEMQVCVCRMVPKVCSVTVCPCPCVGAPAMPSPQQAPKGPSPKQAPLAAKLAAGA